MVSCKLAPHIRRLGASLAHHARGFCHTVDAGEESSSLGLLKILEKSVEASGKTLVSLLRRRLQEEEQARLILLQLVQEKERFVQAELRMRAKDKIELLQARGLNDTRGLFEMLQECLAQGPNITPGKKGADLWEEILASDPALAACIERCTKVRAANRSKQALQCYNVYAVLSQHVHAGKQLAHLQAQSGGIQFQRGPLTPEQVEVLLCLGTAAGVKLVPLE